MRKFNRGALIGGVVAALTATTIAVTSAGATTGPTTTAGSGFQQRFDAGELRLVNTTPSTVVITRYDADGAVVATQTLTADGRCGVTSSGSPLLRVDPAGGRQDLGLVSSGLGVRSKSNCSTDSGRIGQGQSLTVRLGTALAADIRIDAAELDIEAKFGAGLSYSLDEGAAETVSLSATTSDNGPDAGAADNNRIAIGAVGGEQTFRSIRLAPVADGKGEIALEGGGDYGPLPAAAGTETVFHLVKVGEQFDYALGCGQMIEKVAAASAPTPAGAFPISFEAYRYDDIGDEDCQPIGAEVSFDGVTVLFEKTVDSVTGDFQDPFVRVEMIWVIPQTEIANNATEFIRRINFWPDDPSKREDAQYCASFDPPGAASAALPVGEVVRHLSLDIGSGVLDWGVAEHQEDSRFDLVPDDGTGRLPWCVILDERSPGTYTYGVVDENGDPVMDGDKQRTETIPVVFQRIVWDGQGDPKFF